MYANNREKITVPMRGSRVQIDIESFLPVIDHPCFQRLRYITQLGVLLMYPAANHSRFEHSLGVLEETRRRLASWPALFNEKEARTILLYGLLHDIGHTAFSHATEGVIGHKHEKMAIHFIKKMEKQINSCGADYDLLLQMFEGKSSLGCIVTNHPLGTDKIDYLTRDALRTDMDYPNVEYLDNRVYWHEDRLVVHDSLEMIRRVTRYREIYVSAYGEIYLCRSGMNAQRLLEKMWEYQLELGLTRRKIANATEFEALTWFQSCESKDCRRLAKKYLNRQLPKTAIAFRLHNCSHDEDQSKYPVKTIEISYDTFKKLGRQFDSPSKLTKLERLLEKEFRLPRDSVVVTPQFHGERYSSHRIWVVRDSQLYSLDELYPVESQKALSMALNYTAWRISALTESVHVKLRQRAKAVFSVLTSIS